MSGIVGIFNRDGAPVNEKIARTLLNAIADWDPDDRGIWRKGPVSIGHAMLWTTPESKKERLPFREGPYILTADARIDNREELSKRLGLPSHGSRGIGDSRLILAAYETWGTACTKYLLGDFAFALWDEREKRLFCARDPIGIKPFYYYLDEGRFLFSNQIRGILASPGVDASIDEEAIGMILRLGQLMHPEKTPFKSVRKLPPATNMIVSGDKIIKEVYWRAEDSSEVRFKTLDEYVQALRNLLEDAVAKRLRSEDPIASHLSGGLDSSTLAVLAARRLKERGRTLYAYNWVPPPRPGDDPGHYEWANSRRISEREGIALTHIDLTAERLCEILENYDIGRDGTGDLWYETLVREDARKKGVRTILTGWGGDELISYGARAYYSMLLHQGRIIELAREIYREARKGKNTIRGIASKIYYWIFPVLLPDRVYCLLPRTRCPSHDYLLCAKPEFAVRVKRMKVGEKTFKMKSLHQDQLDLFNQGHIVNRIESFASCGSRYGVEYVYPLLDRRIVEFALGIPQELYVREGKSRYLFRAAVEGWLPEEIRWGNFKDEPRRARTLVDLYEEAIKIWSKSPPVRGVSRYISRERLVESLRSLDGCRRKGLEERFVYLNSIFIAILILNLEWRLSQE